MPLVKNVAVILWDAFTYASACILKAAIKSLLYVPLFYGGTRLLSHHAPSHDMWLGFAFAAGLFTSVNKKAKKDPNHEKTQRPPIAIILPTSMTSSADPPR